MNLSANPVATGSPRSMKPVRNFPLLGAIMATIAGGTLAWRRAALDTCESIRSSPIQELKSVSAWVLDLFFATPLSRIIVGAAT